MTCRARQLRPGRISLAALIDKSVARVGSTAQHAGQGSRARFSGQVLGLGSRAKAPGPRLAASPLLASNSNAQRVNRFALKRPPAVAIIHMVHCTKWLHHWAMGAGGVAALNRFATASS
jgi:hypothetical protein